jgi:hypothetical protein
MTRQVQLLPGRGVVILRVGSVFDLREQLNRASTRIEQIRQMVQAWHCMVLLGVRLAQSQLLGDSSNVRFRCNLVPAPLVYH